jgi:hypothetical protein
VVDNLSWSDLWMFYAIWAIAYWGTVLVVGGSLAWCVDRSARVFLVGGVVAVGVGGVLWSPLVSLDSGHAVAAAWVTAGLIGLGARACRNRGAEPV